MATPVMYFVKPSAQCMTKGVGPRGASLLQVVAENEMIGQKNIDEILKQISQLNIRIILLFPKKCSFWKGLS